MVRPPGLEREGQVAQTPPHAQWMGSEEGYVRDGSDPTLRVAATACALADRSRPECRGEHKGPRQRCPSSSAIRSESDRHFEIHGSGKDRFGIHTGDALDLRMIGQ